VRLFCFAMQRPVGPAENSRTSAIAGPSRLPSDRPLEGRGRALRHRAAATELSTLMEQTAYTTVADKSRKRETSSGTS
jgi:hypothetical protein